MKKTKVIIPALGILLLSTAASVTGTVAWFSMNSEVTASGMNLKAKAENGILISNNNSENAADWKEAATALYDGTVGDPAAQAEFIPTSTYDATTWAHANSNTAASHAATSEYVVYSVGGEGIAEANGIGSKAGQNYYLLNNFYIKSSGAQFTSDLKVEEVNATGSSASTELNKSLRVLIKSGSNVKVFAPFAPTQATDLTYNVAKASGAAATVAKQSVTAIDSSDPDAVSEVLIAGATIPAYAATSGITVNVYVYFEGEDVNCKSANITTTLDTLALNIKFSAIDA